MNKVPTWLRTAIEAELTGGRYHVAEDCPALRPDRLGVGLRGRQLHVSANLRVSADDVRAPQNMRPQWQGPVPARVGYTVVMDDGTGAVLPFPESDVLPTKEEAESYRAGCEPNERYRYVVVALVACERVL
ncbi:hypothetical protein [Streptosporangium longisporum]